LRNDTQDGEQLGIGQFRKVSFPIANRSESADPESEANLEGEAEIRGETGIEGQKSGQRASGVEIANAGANRH